ncbi:MAG: phosphatidate cytidylyltransferase [Coriobacteriales bacterium]|nr:phosphatidate cytidylyltransferase [Coriobacteriales bacterium]
MAINVKNLAKRTAPGIIYAAIVTACLFISWYTTVLVVAAVAGLCAYEFLRMANNAGHKTYIVIGTGTAILIPSAVGVAILLGRPTVLPFALGVCFVSGVIIMLKFVGDEKDSIVDASLTLFSIFYTGLMLSALILIRTTYEGIWGGFVAWGVIGIVWLNDIAAYLGGSAFGKHKFMPKISPKKTWEGVICGIIVGILVWLLIPTIYPGCGFGLVYAAICGLICSIVAIIGDLCESHIKRSFNCKDSGDLMPGHGGLLDRNDSVIFAVVVAYALIAIAPYVFNLVGFVF